MNKLAKNILLGVAVIGFAATTILGITYSKYTNVVSGDGETQVAKWSFKVNEQTEEFATIKLADTYDASTLTKGKIAPGTSGSFDIDIDATGAEVGVKYVVDFEDETNKPTNLIFKSGNKSASTIEELEEVLTGTINADDTNKTRTLTVEWEWPYETKTDNGVAQNDEIDTAEGLNALEYSFNVKVTGTQVIPSK